MQNVKLMTLEDLPGSPLDLLASSADFTVVAGTRVTSNISRTVASCDITFSY